MEYITLSKDNIDKEHICCAISNNNDIQVSSKKDWLKDRFDDGLVFIKSKERGKCFIEYLPLENAWVPIVGENYMFIDCLWVSGKFKGHGYSNDLLNMCIEDSKAKGKEGICILSSTKKRGFLADSKYLIYKGFKVVDTSSVGISIMCLSFNDTKNLPSFTNKAKEAKIDNLDYVLYYTNQCPFTAKYVPIIETLARNNNVPFKTIHITNKEQARNICSPITTYALFYNGNFITNEILSDKKFLKLIKE